VGAALSARVRRTRQVAVAFFGDGAANIGTVHESMNMASIWQLPVIFVCENNGYAQATPAEYALSVKDVADRGAAYGMPGVIVDGQDVVAVWEASQAAVERARSGGGPTLIECKTYRYYGHHQGDNPLRYRTAEEERLARERDCLARFRERMRQTGPLTSVELDELDARSRRLIDDAVAFAQGSPVPDADQLLTHVYVARASDHR
jgi:TPP-dependent pyruvate/acetoin dehydrogenase alpha subunit